MYVYILMIEVFRNDVLSKNSVGMIRILAVLLSLEGKLRPFGTVVGF